jgi:trk system potassium uptake protein TrkH
MKLRIVSRCVGAVVIVVGATMATAAPVAWMMHDAPGMGWRFLLASLLVMALGLGAVQVTRDNDIGVCEGYAIVTFSWVAATLVSAIPYVWIGDLSVVDAVFESMSGFTTTGSTILTDIEAFGEGAASLLYWRSMTQWLGGMGIVVLSLAILPILGIGGMQLYKAEVPGPTSDQLTPRIASTAKFLWLLYLVMTCLEAFLLYLSPEVNAFEAWCHAATTLSTGGFSTNNDSVAGFGSAYVEWVITIFMFLAAVNFTLHLRALKGDWKGYRRDDEFRFFFGLFGVGAISIAICIMASGRYPMGEAIRHSFFTVGSIVSTTGFGTEDYDLWPSYARGFLIFLMFVGGCGGSTSGGMKISRIMILLRHGLQQITCCLYPRAVLNIRVDGRRLPNPILGRILGFFFIFLTLVFLLSLTLTVVEPGLDGPDHNFSSLETAFSASVTCIANVGPGLGAVGPSQNFAWMAEHTKILLVLGMLIGRLEIFTVIVLLQPSLWRR